MAELNLDDIRTAAEAKYDNLTIRLGEDKVVLLNPLHMTREARAKLMKLQETLDVEGDEDTPDVDQQAVFEDTIRTVSMGDGGERLVKAIGGNLAVLAETMEKYNEACQVGEA